MRALLSFITVALLILPFAALAFFAGGFRFELNDEVMRTVLFTALQAAMSAAASLVCGVLGAYGLNAFSRFKLLEKAILLPNAAPVILTLLATLKLFPWARGLAGITLVHTFLNTGLVAVAAARLFREKVSGQAELAWLEGASRWLFLRRGVLPLLRDDLVLLFLFVFAVCFSSFAVPLVLGGSQATTMEVLIYQKIRIAGDWSGALGLAVIQLAAVLVLTLLLRREPGAALAGRTSNAPLLSLKAGIVFALAPVAVLVIGLSDGILAGIQQVFSMEMLLKEYTALLGGSIVVGVGVGIATAILLLLLAYVGPRGWLRRFLIAYVAPSSVLTGFSLLVLWRSAEPFAAFARIILGITLVTVPAFYRLQWDATLRGFEGQRLMAWLLGAGDRLIFLRVIFPQVIRPACFFGGLAALWAWGDFALSAVVAGRTLTVAMLVQSLMESYRLDAATALVWTLIGGGIATFLLFVGVGNVLGSQSES